MSKAPSGGVLDTSVLKFCNDENNSVIRSAVDALSTIPQKITFLTVTDLFLFAFFNLILDAPRMLQLIKHIFSFFRLDL